MDLNSCIFLLLSPVPQSEQLPKLSPICVSRHISNSLSAYLFLNFELQLGKSKEFNNEEMEAQVKRAFKSFYFLPLKETIKKQTSSAWSFLQQPMQLCSGGSIPHFEINAPLLRISQTSRQDQENGKGTYCWLLL